MDDAAIVVLHAVFYETSVKRAGGFPWTALVSSATALAWVYSSVSSLPLQRDGQLLKDRLVFAMNLRWGLPATWAPFPELWEWTEWFSAMQGLQASWSSGSPARAPPRQLAIPAPRGEGRPASSSTAGLGSATMCGRAAVFDIFSDELDWAALATDEANVVLNKKVTGGSGVFFFVVKVYSRVWANTLAGV